MHLSLRKPWQLLHHRVPNMQFAELRRVLIAVFVSTHLFGDSKQVKLIKSLNLLDSLKCRWMTCNPWETCSWKTKLMLKVNINIINTIKMPKFINCWVFQWPRWIGDLNQNFTSVFQSVFHGPRSQRLQLLHLLTEFSLQLGDWSTAQQTCALQLLKKMHKLLVVLISFF